MTDCTINGNNAAPPVSGGGGGGLYSNGTLSLTNCTVSGNTANIEFGRGGGLCNIGTATLTNCTVSGNSASSEGGGGLYTKFFGATTTLTNTIVAGNLGVFDALGNRTGTNNLIGGNPLLAPLGNYGGPTQTMALLPGSPAIDAGTSTGAPSTDQRGLPRFNAVDIGAFESQGFNFSFVPGSTPQTSNIGTAFAIPLAVSVTANNAIEPVNGGGGVSFVASPAANGATAILTTSSPVIAGGQAADTAVPNNVLGSYTVVATFPGSSASISLTNAGRVYTKLVVNTTSDSLAPGAGLLSLREAIAFNNTSPSGNAAHHLRPDRLRYAEDDSPYRRPARAE